MNKNNWDNRIKSSGSEDPHKILANPANFRKHPKWQQDALAGVLDEIGWIQDVIINTTTGHLIDGHLRVELAVKRKEAEIPVKYVELTEREEKIALASIDPISALAEQDQAQLNSLIAEIGDIENDDLAAFLNGLRDDDEGDEIEREAEQAKESLRERFLIPPFSVLDARQGEWANRKATWLKLGIKSELGRGNGDDKTKKGITYAVSSQPPHVYEAKNQIEKELGQKLSWTEFGEKYPELISMAGTSIFDPVLTELMYTWFCPPAGKILDPFAGGSVRGIVAGFLGYNYTGIELRKEQVTANRAQAKVILGGDSSNKADHFTGGTSDPDELTPIQTHAGIRVKRDDLFTIAGVRGGKVRSCYALAKNAKGLVTAGSRQSPQVNIVASIAKHLGIPCSIHTPTGKLSPEVKAATGKGAEITQHKAGYNNVIVARAREDAKERGWTEIPFGMECAEAIAQTRKQTANIPEDIERIVMPAGSGMSLSGVLWGLKDHNRNIKVLAVKVGADPTDRLDEYAPADWRETVTLVESGLDYHDEAPAPYIGDLKLDPIYEGKAAKFATQTTDLFWVVGIRETAVPTQEIKGGSANWINDDSRNVNEHIDDETQDFLFTCPPYADLEVYSDDPLDLSTLEYDDFLIAYKEIIKKASAKLKNNTFAVCVVGEVRDKKGRYYGFVQDTIQAFKEAGLEYYNEAILITQIGSLAIRITKQFNASRKVGKTHQNALVFTKGNPEPLTIPKLAEAVTEHFNQHKKMITAANNVLVFTKGDPKQATKSLGNVVVQDLDALAVDIEPS